MDKFYRCINLKTHFQDTPKLVDLSDEEYRFESKINKNSDPTKRHYTIDIFIEVTKEDINEQLTKNKKSLLNNGTKKELGVLEQLERHDDIIINSANKGGVTVI